MSARLVWRRRVVVACAALVLPWAGAQATALDTFLGGLSTWTAAFSQSVTDTQGKVSARGTGNLTLVRPGRFRWEFTPVGAGEGGQLLVADGRNLWFLDRDLDQVTVKPIDQALSQTPAMLLAGSVSRLEDSFVIQTLPRTAGLDWVNLAPRGAEADYRSAKLGFAGAQLRQMVLEDKLGQTVTINFEAGVRNASVDAGKTQFTPSAGVNVIGTPLK